MCRIFETIKNLKLWKQGQETKVSEFEVKCYDGNRVGQLYKVYRELGRENGPSELS